MIIRSVLVIGAGAWGTAIASVFARGGSRTSLWDCDKDTMETMRAKRSHPKFFGGRKLHPDINFISDLGGQSSIDYVVFVVPFQKLRSAMETIHGSALNFTGVVCASKGLELRSHALAHEIASDTFGDAFPFAQISGPNFATEVFDEKPAAVAVGGSSHGFSEIISDMMSGDRFRPYATDDMVGVEIGGALKNIIAIAAGISDGLNLGSNARAALITRGLSEIARCGNALGADTQTFMGLSGMGDLVLTCTDDQSRNRRFGMALARLKNVDDAKKEVGELVEGVATALAVFEMAEKAEIEMPIICEVAAILNGIRPPEDAVRNLLTRNLIPEGG